LTACNHIGDGVCDPACEDKTSEPDYCGIRQGDVIGLRFVNAGLGDPYVNTSQSENWKHLRSNSPGWGLDTEYRVYFIKDPASSNEFLSRGDQLKLVSLGKYNNGDSLNSQVVRSGSCNAGGLLDPNHLNDYLNTDSAGDKDKNQEALLTLCKRKSSDPTSPVWKEADCSTGQKIEQESEVCLVSSVSCDDNNTYYGHILADSSDRDLKFNNVGNQPSVSAESTVQFFNSFSLSCDNTFKIVWP
jgi:hypothetical protein